MEMIRIRELLIVRRAPRHKMVLNQSAIRARRGFSLKSPQRGVQPVGPTAPHALNLLIQTSAYPVEQDTSLSTLREERSA